MEINLDLSVKNAWKKTAFTERAIQELSGLNRIHSEAFPNVNRA